MEQSENNNGQKTTENIKVLLNERGKGEKQGFGKEKDKGKHNAECQSKECRWERRRRHTLSEEIKKIPPWPSYEIP